MSRLSEKEIQEIMEEYKDAPMVNPDKIYPLCRLSRTSRPLSASQSR